MMNRLTPAAKINRITVQYTPSIMVDSRAPSSSRGPGAPAESRREIIDSEENSSLLPLPSTDLLHSAAGEALPRMLLGCLRPGRLTAMPCPTVQVEMSGASMEHSGHRQLAQVLHKVLVTVIGLHLAVSPWLRALHLPVVGGPSEATVPPATAKQRAHSEGDHLARLFDEHLELRHLLGDDVFEVLRVDATGLGLRLWVRLWRVLEPARRVGAFVAVLPGCAMPVGSPS